MVAMAEVVLILAGNEDKARRYAAEKGLKPGTWRYVRSVRDLLDVQGGRILKGPQYTKHPECWPILIAAKERGIEEE